MNKQKTKDPIKPLSYIRLCLRSDPVLADGSKAGTSLTDGCRVNTRPIHGPQPAALQGVFRLETVNREVAG